MSLIKTIIYILNNKYSPLIATNVYILYSFTFIRRGNNIVDW